MPYLKLDTNLNLDDSLADTLLGELTELVSKKLSKPLEYIQVRLDAGQKMQFAGTDEPTCYIELRSLGFPDDGVGTISAAICDLIGERLNVAPTRIFINFVDVPRNMWGWNGTTFG